MTSKNNVPDNVSFPDLLIVFSAIIILPTIPALAVTYLVHRYVLTGLPYLVGQVPAAISFFLLFFLWMAFGQGMADYFLKENLS